MVNARFRTTPQHLRPVFPHKLTHTADKLYLPRSEPIRTVIARGVTAVFLEDNEQGVKTNFNRRIFTLAVSFPIIITDNRSLASAHMVVQARGCEASRSQTYPEKTQILKSLVISLPLALIRRVPCEIMAS